MSDSLPADADLYTYFNYLGTIYRAQEEKAISKAWIYTFSYTSIAKRYIHTRPLVSELAILQGLQTAQCRAWRNMAITPSLPGLTFSLTKRKKGR